MTCIVGLVREDRVYLGADSAAVDVPSTQFIEQWSTPKTFKRDPFVFAFAGSWLVGQLVRLSLAIPDINDTEIEVYLVSKFIPALKKLLVKEGVEKDDEWVLLIGYENRLFRLGMEFSLGEPLDGFTAEGTGRDFAMGALHSVLASKKSPNFCITTALTAAAKYCPNVKEPFVYVSTTEPN